MSILTRIKLFLYGIKSVTEKDNEIIICFRSDKIKVVKMKDKEQATKLFDKLREK